MNDWAKFVPVIAEVLGWYSLAYVAHCPECGKPGTVGGQAPESETMLIHASHGVAIPVICELGHRWTLRISSWRSEYPGARKKLAARQRVWQLEDLQAEIRSKEREVETLKEKYFDMRKELIEGARAR